MAAPMRENVENILNDFKNVTGKPIDFLTIKKSHANKLTKTLKTIYDATKCNERKSDKSTALQELIVKGFDDEQIWQELELQNDATVTGLLTQVARLLTDKSACTFRSKQLTSSTSGVTGRRIPPTVAETVQQKTRPGSDKHEDVSDVSDTNITDDESDSAGSDDEISKIKSKLDEDNDKFFDFTGDSDDDLNFDFGPLGDGHIGSDGEDNKAGKDNKKKSVHFEEPATDKSDNAGVKGKKVVKSNKHSKKGSAVDDAFFKLSELETFLVQEDKREERRQRQEKDGESDSDEEEEDIDMFADIEEVAEEDLHYDDFFDPPDGKVERSQEDEEKGDSGATYDDEEGEDDEEDDDDEGDDDDEDDEEDRDDQEEGDKDKTSMLRPAYRRDLLPESDSEGEDAGEILSGRREHMSSYEQRQIKLKKKINQMEDASLEQKPWQLSGEITAANRPENSLLQESVQFEHTTRLPPEITEETTKTLEDLVRQRIKDKVWDDVERKVKPKDNPFEYKKRLTLDQEKSKLSLGEIYEQEFLRQQKTEQEEQTDPDHTEIKKMMQTLFIKLDALSNFHYTPKQAAPEVKVVSNQPSIAIEEVAPVSVSDNKLLAPQEIQDKQQGELKGDTEKSKTDKFRERKQKKSAKRQRQKEREQREKLIEKLNPGLGNKHSKEKALKKLEKESKSGKGVTLIKEDKKTKTGLTSSKSFFTQLQDEVTTGIRSKKAEKRKNKTDEQRSSKKFKL